MEAITGDDDNGRSSKKKAFISNPSSSLHKVLSDDDLLIEILLLLPLLSLYHFKRVSKQWLSIITSTSFIFRRTQISGIVPPSGIFIEQSTSNSAYDFLSFDSRKLAKRSTVFTYNSETGTESIIKQSCNGLLLCYINVRDFSKHFVYNPLLSTCKMLPPIRPLNYFYNNISGMAFDPTKSPHYKVVHYGSVHDPAAPPNHVYGWATKIQTYSSQTGVWSLWDDLFPDRSFIGFEKGIYWNGAIHWLYNDPFHYKLEIVDRPVLTNIQTPLTVEGEVHHDRKLFGSYGSLLLLCKDYYHSRNLNIYEMKHGYSEWSIKYIVNLNNMLTRRTWRLPEYWDCYNIWSIFIGEQEEDSFMVIELSRKVLQYKFASKTVTKLLDLRKEVGGHQCHYFIASFAHL